MTTHVFIVDDNTFKYHLEYMFAGTGAKEKKVDFNNLESSTLHHSTEDGLICMMADGCRIRKNDLIIFYLQANKEHEGLFFGVFQAIENGIFLDNFDKGQFLYEKLEKSLTFRLRIKPIEVYPKGVTEWSALDEINNIRAPFQMLWSLIYRKLKGNRGNTMITIYESERLMNLIRNENNNISLNCLTDSLTYDNSTYSIVTTTEKFSYVGRAEPINILPRLIRKYKDGKAHEAHLQMYIAQNLGLGINKSLDDALGITESNIEWLGNEVSCGVGMQRIDIMFSVSKSNMKRILYQVELKATPAYEDNTRQLNRYIDWIEQYYVPNRISIIQPVLICKSGVQLSEELRYNFRKFNKRKGILQLRYIEYDVVEDELVFHAMEY